MFNASLNVYKTEWLDLVFENRNKIYGAYKLRKQSSKIVLKSLAISTALFFALFIMPLIYNRLHPVPIPNKVTVVNLQDPIYDMKKTKKQEPAPKSEPLKEKIKTVKMVSKIEVVKDPIIEEPPTVDEIKDAIISNTTQKGKIADQTIISDGKVNGAGTEVGNNAGDEIVDVVGVERYPEFVGGMQAWYKYIQKNLRYSYMAQDNGVQGKVFVSFVVERDGSVSNVTIVNGIGSGCDEEAMRVISKSPKWNAGENNGKKVRVRYTMPIVFALAE